MDHSCGNWAEPDLAHGHRSRSVQSNQVPLPTVATSIERQLGRSTVGRVWSKGSCNDQCGQQSVEP